MRRLLPALVAAPVIVWVMLICVVPYPAARQHVALLARHSSRFEKIAEGGQPPPAKRILVAHETGKDQKRPAVFREDFLQSVLGGPLIKPDRIDATRPDDGLGIVGRFGVTEHEAKFVLTLIRKLY